MHALPSCRRQKERRLEVAVMPPLPVHMLSDLIRLCTNAVLTTAAQTASVTGAVQQRCRLCRRRSRDIQVAWAALTYDLWAVSALSWTLLV
jgi:hypothetical protein